MKGEFTPEAPSGRIGRLRRRLIDLRSRTPWWVLTLLATAMVAGLFLLDGLRDLDAIDGRAIERAEVVAVHGRGPIIFDGCGKSEGSRADVVWRSQDPPPGYPATFTDSNSCNGDVTAGEFYRIVRDDGSDDPVVTVDPVTSWRQAIQWSGIGGGIALGALLLVQGTRAAWRRWWRPRVARRRMRGLDL